MPSRAPRAPRAHRSSARRRVATTAVAVTLILGVVLAMVWSLQRSLIYFPDSSPVPAAHEVLVLPGARDLVLHTEDGLELGAWLVPADAAADRGLAVLYAPGNGGNRESRAGLALELSRRGFTVLLLDYRGYGGNPGTPTESGLALDALAAAEVLEREGYPPGRTIYFGESLGTGVVAALSAQRPPAGLVLRSPFPDLAAVARHHYPWLPVQLLLRDRFPVSEHLATGTVPVTVVRAAYDSVVPSRLSAQVAQDAPALVEEVVVEGVDHNSPELFGAPVADAVARLADALPRP